MMEFLFWRLMVPGADTSTALASEYRLDLVALSISVAILAAYSALEIVERINDTPGSRTRFWLTTGAICFGIGIWTMHFLGMLAFSLPLPVSYSPGMTLMSILPGIFASGFALYFMSRAAPGFWMLNLGGLLIAVGIGTMHYTGMEAMHMQGVMMAYDPALFALSILVAHVLATTALAFKFRLRSVLIADQRLHSVVSGVFLGLAISGMHYTAMFATYYFPAPFELSEVLPSDSSNLGFYVTMGSSLIVAAGLVGTFIDRRINSIKVKLEILSLPLLIIAPVPLLIVMYWSSEDQLEHNGRLRATQALQQSMLTTARQLEAWRHHYLVDAPLWDNHPIHIQATAELLALTPIPSLLGRSAAQGQLRDAFHDLQRWGRFISFMVIDRQGLIIAADDDRLLGASSLTLIEPGFIEQLMSGQTLLSPPMRAPTTQFKGSSETQTDSFVSWVGSAIEVTPGVPAATVVFSIDLADEYTSILERGRIGASGETFIFSRNGKLLSPLRHEERLRQHALLAPDTAAMLNINIRNPGFDLTRVKTARTRPDQNPLTFMVSSALASGDGSSSQGYLNVMGVPVIGAWSWDSKGDYGIATEQHLSEALITFLEEHSTLQRLIAIIFILLPIFALILILIRIRLIDSQERSSAILDAAFDGIITLNLQGEVESANSAAEQLFAYSDGLMTGESVTQLIPGLRQWVELKKNLSHPLVRHGISSAKLIGRRADGIDFHLEASIIGVNLPTGNEITTLMLRDITAQLESLRILKDQERLEGELHIASEIQSSMLPTDFQHLMEHSQIDVHARLSSAREVGGDFYDLFTIGEGRVCLLVGDVSGKGVAAALFMAMAKILIKSTATGASSPATIISRVNDALAEDNGKCMFVTLLVCVFETASNTMTWCNAGHCPPYLLQGNGDIACLDQRHGPFVGILPGTAYAEDKICIEPGDAIVLYSDGVIEATDANGSMFGKDRLVKLLTTHGGQPAAEIIESVFSRLVDYERGTDQSDDITLLAFRHAPMQPQNEELNVFDLCMDVELSDNVIDDVIDRFTGFARSHLVIEEVIQKFNLAFDELLTNIRSYGFDDDDTSRDVGIHATLMTRYLQVEINSAGVAFNPLDVPAPDTSLSLEQREIGGLGIFLVRQLMDEVEYQRVNENNVLILRHALPAKDSSARSMGGMV